MTRQRSNPPDVSPQPQPRASWTHRASVAALCALLATTGGPCSVERGAEVSRGEGWADPDAVPGSTVRLTLEPGSPDAPRVTVDVYRETEEEPIAHHVGALPLTLSVPRDTALLLVVEAGGRARHAEDLRLEGDRTIVVPLGPGGRSSGRVTDTEGQPVAGAQVRLVPEEGHAWLLRADAEGRFTVDTLIDGVYRVEASARGYASSVRDGVRPGETLNLALERVGLVGGRVIGPDGSGAASATVVIAGSGLWPARQVTTGNDGRFRLGSVPPGVYEVRAFSGNLVAEPRRGLRVEAGQPVLLTFTLNEGAALRGIIRDSVTGAALADAEISVSTETLDAAPRAARSGSDGRFAVAGLSRVGPVRVNVFAAGYVAVAGLEHTPGDELALELEPAATLEGVVLDERRRPIVGASIEVLGETDDRQPVALDSGSGFRASVFAAQFLLGGHGPPGSRSALAHPPVSGARLRERQVPPAELTLAPGPGALEVTAGPVPPIPIHSLETSLAPLSPIAASAIEVRTAAAYLSDDEGRFRVTGVPPGHVQVTARRTGRASASTARLYVAAGAVRDDIELILPPSGRLQGTVLDGRGAGVSGVLVEARSDREPFPRIATTDERGAFAMADVVGELTVTAIPRGEPSVRASVTVRSGATAELELSLARELHAIAGRVVDGAGFPIANVQLGLMSLRAESPFRRTFFSTRDGTFALSELPAPPWRLEASEPGYASTRLDVVSAAEQAMVVLERGARVSGSVLDDYTGAPVAARIVLAREGLPAEVREVRADAEGAFSIAQIRPGAWQLRVESADHVLVERDVDVIDRGRGPRDVDVRPIRLEPAGWLEGTVVDALGAPISRARVRVAEHEASVRTDAQGRFVLRGIPAGSVLVSASHPAAGEGEMDRVRVLAGRETPGLIVRLSERFDPARAAALPGQRRGVALTLVGAGARVLVDEVVRGSHAERAGLRHGDVIEEVDGAAPASAREAAQLLRGAAGVPAILRVRRGDEEAVLVVERESWLPP